MSLFAVAKEDVIVRTLEFEQVVVSVMTPNQEVDLAAENSLSR